MAPPRVWPRPAQVTENRHVGAANLLQGVGQHRQDAPVPVVVGAPREGDNTGRLPGGGKDNGPGQIAKEVTEQQNPLGTAVGDPPLDARIGEARPSGQFCPQ